MTDCKKSVEKIITQKNQIFLLRMLYLILSITSLSVIITLYHRTYGATLVDGSLFLINSICLILARRGYYRTAKFISIITLIVALSGLITLYPIEVSLYIFYLPISIAGFILFADEKRIYIFLSLGLIIVLSVLTVVFRKDMGIKFPISNLEILHSSNFNFLIALLFTWLCIDFFMKTNAETESKLKELTSSLENKNEQLERANKDLDRLIYSTSHDLRSPLASIKGLLDIANGETQDETLLEYFSMMSDRITKLDNFILDMLELSKHQKEEVKNSATDISELINEVITNLQFMDGFNRIDCKVKSHIPHQILTDKHKLAVILSNLISNAIKYHDYTKKIPHITIEAIYEDGLFKIIVEDNGMGISKKNQENIFNLFYRASQKSSGSGLGLAIVAYALEKLNGKIEVESELKKGTIFTVTLPAGKVIRAA